MGTVLKFAIAAIAFILAAPLATTAFSASKAIIVDPVASVSDKRVALVIGNASYGQKSENGIIVPNLVNPLNDARAIRDTLTNLGFRIVYGENLTKKELEHAIGTFANLVEDADVAITYFSGHGSTFGDVPYLVPVDAEFDSLEAIPYELVRVEDFIGELRRAKGVRIALIDACRDNGADQALKSAAKTKGVGQTKGLARVANPDGLIIVYATQFLTTAADGDVGNSPFAAALVQHLPTPGEDVKNVLFDVANDVVSRTKGEQRPEVSVSLFESFTLNPGGPAASSPPVAAMPANAEVVFWNSILNSTNRLDFDAYLKDYPNGAFVDLAHNRLTSLDPVITPLTPSAGPDNRHSDFSDLSIVPFHNAQAIHTFSDKDKKYVFIYCTQPGNVKTIAITLSYGNRPPDKSFVSTLPKHVSAATLSVEEMDGTVKSFTASQRVTRTYRAASGEYKTDIVLRFEDREFDKLTKARDFRAAESGYDISQFMNFEVKGSREPFDTATKSCVS